MTDEQINVAIAEACGWSEILAPISPPEFCRRPTGIFGNSDRKQIPNYCNDLNVMHEAEKVFLAGFEDKPEFSELWSNYQTNLIIAGVAYRSYHATARQRAEAFLRTLGLWKEVQE